MSDLGRFVEPADLNRTLQEMGPNEVTEFADALVVDGAGPKEVGWPFDVWENIGSFRDAFTQFLVGRRHAFIGGAAARSYRARGGPTMDYDVLIAQPELTETHRFLESQGAELRDSVEDTYHYRVISIGLDVDIRVARSELDREALAQAHGATYQERRLQIVRPEHLAAMKVKAYSERKDEPKGRQDRDDVLGLLRVGATRQEVVRDVLSRHRPDLLAHLDEILAAPR